MERKILTTAAIIHLLNDFAITSLDVKNSNNPNMTPITNMEN